ncbi:KTSC domain-containing protein [Halomonas sp. LBP4]|uniref:KTSC domain-containing protein n=1 Tax=Halomonas sp. LBP4 TaxID=2044917 RepID=UPI000D763579|nr:KTSC domain-containing protein [Halomonas sp. LBP4]
MEMIRVRSSAISSVGYDPDSMHMKIRFTSGGTYTYCRVPQYIFDGLLSASSKGSYFDRHIRDRFQC